MVYSPLAKTGKDSPQSSSRQGAKIDRFIVHHAVSTRASTVVDMMTIPTKQVSANYVVGPDGPIGVVPEDYRAWTSGASGDGGRGAAFDRRAITVETINSTLAPDYAFNPKTLEHLARLIADVATRYGFPLDRDHVLGHRELYERFRASYATACPGPSMDLDELVRTARAIQQGAPTVIESVPAVVKEIVMADFAIQAIEQNQNATGPNFQRIAVYGPGLFKVIEPAERETYNVLRGVTAEASKQMGGSFMLPQNATSVDATGWSAIEQVFNPNYGK